MIPGQARTVACLGFSYVTKIAAVAVLLFAISEIPNVVSMVWQARRD